MKTTRVLLAGGTLALALMLTACGGDGDEKATAGGSGSDTSADAGDNGDDGGDAGEAPVPLMQGEDCDATVEVTGQVEANWDGDGVVSTSDSDVAPLATYQAADGAAVLTLYAEGNGFDAGAILLFGDDQSFGTAVGADGLEIADDGSGATIDADLDPPFGSQTDSVHVVAEFSC